MLSSGIFMRKYDLYAVLELTGKLLIAYDLL